MRPIALLLLFPACVWIPGKGDDRDGDGYTLLEGDCWDTPDQPPGSRLSGADIHPDAAETWYDGFDQNCDQKDDYDADGDHFVPLEEQVGLPTYGVPGSGEDHLGGGDCWDASPALEVPLDKVVVGADIDVDEAGLAFTQPTADLTFPGAIDTWYDGLDQDCAGNSDFDQDADGFDAELHRQGDGAVGDDCLDGSWRDDGHNPAGSDPVDVNPAGTEVWYDGTDQDCDDNDCDADEDGADADPIAAGYCEGLDCDDNDPGAFPNDTPEVYYNGTDDNCVVADGDGDMDGDGHWSVDYDSSAADDTVQVPDNLDDCWDDTTTTPDEMVPANGASALTAAEVNPGAADRPYDRVPQDCVVDGNGDGVDDDIDWDGDGYASEVNGAGDDCLDCPLDQAGTAWYIDYCGGETANPAALDAILVNSGVGLDDPYDGTDANCDDWNDYDQDHDGHVAAEYDILAGSVLCGGVACQTGDCDDSLSAIHPGAADAWYSGADEDCDGRDDYDADEDGYVYDVHLGLGTVGVPSAGALPGGDCDDTDPNRHPDATETCATIYDDDCDGSAAESNAAGCIDYYADVDNDGYGDPAVHDCLCVVTSTYETTNNTDCDDTDSARSPAKTEVCDSLDKDEDCDLLSDNNDSSATTASKTTYYLDSDADGYGSTTSAKYCDLPSGYSAVNTDCDDTDAARSPALTEVCDSANKDEDCDSKSDDSDSSVDGTTKSTWYLDGDKDNYLKSSATNTAKCDRPTGSSTTQYLLSTEASSGTDCDDTSATINPGAQEICDASNTDEDCDGSADNNDTSALASGKTTYYLNADSDTYGSTTTATFCDKPTGYSAVNTDCDDTTATRSPGNTEVCDSSNTDEDCDLLSDNNDSSASAATKTTYYADTDGDGYGNPSASAAYCDLPSTGYSALSTDCDDTKATRSPALTEVCDAANLDEDCDLVADNNDSSASAATKSTFYVDADGDSYGSTTSAQYCDLPASGYSTVNNDCDDTKATRSPALTEVCDAADLDEDCDLLSDNNDPSASAGTKTTYYLDSDGDGYGGTTSASYCDKPTGYAVLNTDCNDSSATIKPGGTEVCDSANTDEDCDGLADNDDPSASVATRTSFYIDADEDGSGSSGTILWCDLPASFYSTTTGDCDDNDSTRSPTLSEVCDSENKDEDCDSLADDLDPSVSAATKSTFYLDADGDGAGGTTSATYCDSQTGYTTTSTDCNDSFYSVTTGTVGAGDTDTDGIDDDCDGLVDEGSVAVGNIWINEWMINPAGTGVQWFELKNPSTTKTYYLDGWKLILTQNIASSSSTVATIYLSVDAAVTIPPSSFAVFCEENASTWTSANCDYFFTSAPSWYHAFVTPYITGVSADANFTFDVFTTGSDTNTLSLGFVDGGASTTIDYVAYDSTFPQFTGGYAMRLDATGTASTNNNASKWTVAASTPTYTDGGTQRGTAGCANTATTCP